MQSTISIHAPRVGSDLGHEHQRLALGKFLSTLPAWGATKTLLRVASPSMHFYPRSPRGERHYTAGTFGNKITVFLSTLPAWGATASRIPVCSHLANFYPRSPRGERPVIVGVRVSAFLISIHAPRVGSDVLAGDGFLHLGFISIHAPRVGSDTGDAEDRETAS